MESNCVSEENYEQENFLETKECRNESNNVKKEISDNCIKLTKTKKSNRRSSEMKLKLRDVTVEDLRKLCEQISTLNERIMNVRELTYLRYDLPVEMKDRLEMEAQELECLYAEMKDATKTLEIIRVQRAAMGKEKQWMEAQIHKLKAEAVTEMEMIVSVYDSAMMERWEQVKQSNSIPQVENFLHDVKGKLEAMKNLQILGANKLAELQSQEKRKGEVVTKKEKKKLNREERGGGGNCSIRSGHLQQPSSNHSLTALPFIFDTESEDQLDDSSVLDSVMYNLMYDQMLNLNFSPWTHGPQDID